MTTFYLDFEGGNDSNDGTSFANRWQTFSGGPLKTRVTPGDVVRMMGCPPPFYIGTGLWTSGPFTKTNFVSGSHNTVPIIFLSSGDHGLSNGDAILIGNHATNTQANGVWQVSGLDSKRLVLIGSSGNGAGVRTGWWVKANPGVVFLESGRNLLLEPGRSAWISISANCSVSTNANRKFGPFSSSFGLTTLAGQGAVMPWGSPTALDLTSYSGISFWYNCNSTLGATANLQFQLCTGTRGQGPGISIAIPTVTTPINRWTPFTYYGPLSGNIRSFAIRANSATMTLLLNNIVAFQGSGDGEITHSSLLSTDPNSNRWYPIRGMNNNMVVLDTFANDSQATNTNLAYDGPTQITGVWVMQPVLTTPETTLAGRQHNLTLYGCSGVTFLGGYDRVDMSTKNSKTYISYQGSLGKALSPFTANNMQSGTECSFTEFGIVRCGVGIETSFGNVYSGFAIIGCETGIANRFDNNGANFFYSGVVQGSNYAGVDLARLSSARGCQFHGVIFNNNRQAHAIPATTTIFHDCQFIGNSGGGPLIKQLGDEGDTVLHNCYSSGNSASFEVAGPASFKATNCAFLDTQETISNVPFTNAMLSSAHHDGVINTHKIYATLATADSETDVRHGTTGLAWRVSFNYGLCDRNHPFTLPIGKAFIKPGDTLTISCWARRTFTSVSAELYCPKGQVPGITQDRISSLPAAPDTWQELSFTVDGATATGCLDIYVRAYKTNGTTAGYAYFDDFTISSASEAPNLGYTSYGVPLVTNYPSGQGSTTYVSRSNFGKGWN